LPEQISVGGHVYQDDTIGWQAEGVAHCFIEKEASQLFVDAYGAGQLSIEPWDLIPTWDRARETDLYRVFSESQRTRQRTFAPGENVIIDVRPGARYAITMGGKPPVDLPPDDAPEVQPHPGEHVVLLGDVNTYLQLTLNYIRRFTPDFTFFANVVRGRWAYVTVVATPAQVSDELLDDIRGAGAILVERVIGDTADATKATLDDMVSRGQRFLSAVTPPQEEPPPPSDDGPESPPDTPDEIYVVQPGDTLGRIAQRFYGEFGLWTLIFEANRDKISSPNLIRVGMELLIPPRE